MKLVWARRPRRSLPVCGAGDGYRADAGRRASRDRHIRRRGRAAKACSAVANSIRQNWRCKDRGRLCSPRLCRRDPGLPGPLCVRRLVHAVQRRPAGRLRHDRMDQPAALVERSCRHVRRLAPWPRAVAGDGGEAARPRRDRSRLYREQPLPRRLSKWRSAACADQFRRNAHPSAAVTDANFPRISAFFTTICR